MQPPPFRKSLLITAIAVLGLIAALFVFTLGTAAWLRFNGLGDKPLHSDEAVQAYKLGKLLEGEGYRYDPVDHHGPVMYYMAALVCKIAGQDTFPKLTPEVLRVPQVLSGFALVLWPLLWWRRRNSSGLLRAAPETEAETKQNAEAKRKSKTGSDAAPPPPFPCNFGIGSAAVVATMAFASVSSAGVYYSRYFVQEIMYAASFWFAVILVLRAIFAPQPWKPSRLRWHFALAGLLFGTTIALKETWPLMVAAVGAGLLVICLPRIRATHKSDWLGSARQLALPVGLAAAAALVVIVVFFSSLGQHWQGVSDSVMTFFNYAKQTSGGGHDKPFGYLFKLLFDPQPLFRDILFSVGAGRYARSIGLGQLSAMRELFTGLGCLLAIGMLPVRRAWRPGERSVAVFALVSGGTLLLLHSLIAYKTPWLVVGILPPLWLGAGLGVVAVTRRISLFWADMGVRHGQSAKAILGMVALLAWLTLLGTAFVAQWKSTALLNGKLAADEERNPLAYVHTTEGVAAFEKRAAQIAALVPKNEPVFARVYTAEYWPLPWYLRTWRERGTLFLPDPTRDPSPTLDAPIVITDAATDAAVRQRLRKKYIADFVTLRPGIMLFVYFREDVIQKIAAGATE